MKIQWSVFFSFLLLMTLVSCGSEEFGTTPQSTTSAPDPLKSYQQLSCTSHTLIKPKVDILYVVDNSLSAYYFSSDIKTAINNTVSTVSQQFDYRIIGTTLIPDSTPYNDYQVLTNSTDGLPDPTKKIISASEANFFQSPGGTGPMYAEAGLKRTIDFINGTGPLFRNDAYLLIVLVSNGRDTEVELDNDGDGITTPNTVSPNRLVDRLGSLNQIKSTKNLTQLRFFSVTAKSACKEGWRRSTHSYVAMAGALADSVSYDLCTDSVKNIFAQVNSSIQQQVIPHKYRYWPITFAENDEMVSLSEIRVQKFASNGSSTTLVRDVDWTLVPDAGVQTLPTRELPTSGEPVTGRHFIKFTNLLTYPDCVQVSSISRTEYFGYIVLPREPQLSNMTVAINGRTIPQSSTDGWSYRGNISLPNIKVPYPNAGDELPAIPKSGFMIQLNGSSNYYKSGDNVQVNYVPAGV